MYKTKIQTNKKLILLLVGVCIRGAAREGLLGAPIQQDMRQLPAVPAQEEIDPQAGMEGADTQATDRAQALQHCKDAATPCAKGGLAFCGSAVSGALTLGGVTGSGAVVLVHPNVDLCSLLCFVAPLTSALAVATVELARKTVHQCSMCTAKLNMAALSLLQPSPEELRGVQITQAEQASLLREGRLIVNAPASIRLQSLPSRLVNGSNTMGSNCWSLLNLLYRGDVPVDVTVHARPQAPQTAPNNPVQIPGLQVFLLSGEPVILTGVNPRIFLSEERSVYEIRDPDSEQVLMFFVANPNIADPFMEVMNDLPVQLVYDLPQINERVMLKIARSLRAVDSRKLRFVLVDDSGPIRNLREMQLAAQKGARLTLIVAKGT